MSCARSSSEAEAGDPSSGLGLSSTSSTCSSSTSILDLFPDEAHISSVVTLDPPIVAPDSPVDFSIQPPAILDSFSSSPFNEQVEDE